MAIRCYHCKGYHQDTSGVRNCSGRSNVAQASRRVTMSDLLPTAAQLQYIEDLIKRKGYKGQMKPAESRAHASRIITYLKKQPDMDPNSPKKAIVTFQIVNLIRDGRYAVTPDVTDGPKQYVFFHVTRPKRGTYKDHLVVKTQHGDVRTNRLIYKKSGELVFQNNRMVAGERLSELIGLIVANPYQAAFDFATEKGCCGNCGKQLTDARSIWYGIGPDCEKRNIAHINWVNDMKGVYMP
ncbi:gp079 [Rhodococcus phage ReqiDocB7]|uniref:gp079 n=1 Tax=Rhodococcus phage ReqiDocB7 TaxID=691966 RepID=UPI0001CDD868|nr:gp079 [Rhodococcus phage ReqiDocB7]ADD80865.1 gp079 [Rhodococcus phage ReqiDocB7]